MAKLIYFPLRRVSSLFFFLKLYFIDYAIIAVPDFPLCLPPLNATYSLRQPPQHCSCPWAMRVSSLVIPFPLRCFTNPWLFCNYLLYFLIPSPLYPFPYTLLLSGNHHKALPIHDFLSVVLVYLVCFLDSIIDRYVFIAILLFIVLIFFFLNKSL